MLRRADHRRYPGALLGCLLLLAFSVAPAWADDVMTEIDRAKSLYGEGKLAEAKEALEFAGQLISQKKAAALSGVLPQAAKGWTAVDDKDQAAGTGVFGGVVASRTYKRGGTKCTMTVVGDSPLLAMISMFLTNPSVASTSGAKVQRIAGQRAVITANGEVQVMSANNYLVTVGGDCDEKDKIAYAEGVDYQKLAGF